jgi:hypothetical protein
MVNIAKFLREKKERFNAARDKQSQLNNMARAAELQRLRQERIKVEGKAKLETAKQQELARINAARAKTPSKLAAFGKGIAAVINKGKEHNIKSKGKSYGKGIFGEANRGSTGLQFGGNNNNNRGIDFGAGGGSPFNPGARPAEKKKEPNITIKINR